MGADAIRGSLKGKPVKIRCGRATVMGSILHEATVLQWNGKAAACNEPEPGDLPVVCTLSLREIGRVMRYVETFVVSQL